MGPPVPVAAMSHIVAKEGFRGCNAQVFRVNNGRFGAGKVSREGLFYERSTGASPAFAEAPGTLRSGVKCS